MKQRQKNRATKEVETRVPGERRALTSSSLGNEHTLALSKRAGRTTHRPIDFGEIATMAGEAFETDTQHVGQLGHPQQLPARLQGCGVCCTRVRYTGVRYATQAFIMLISHSHLPHTAGEFLYIITYCGVAKVGYRRAQLC